MPKSMTVVLSSALNRSGGYVKRTGGQQARVLTSSGGMR